MVPFDGCQEKKNEGARIKTTHFWLLVLLSHCWSIHTVPTICYHLLLLHCFIYIRTLFFMRSEWIENYQFSRYPADLHYSVWGKLKHPALWPEQLLCTLWLEIATVAWPRLSQTCVCVCTHMHIISSLSLESYKYFSIVKFFLNHVMNILGRKCSVHSLSNTFVLVLDHLISRIDGILIDGWP